MNYETIIYDLSDGIATVTLNRPDTMNAMVDEMFSELNDVVANIPDSGARVLLLTGAGRGFCSGASLSGDGLTDIEASVRNGLNRTIQSLADLDIPFVTAVNGAAAGAGCALALAGDLVVASRTAYFLQSFVNVGLIPDGGSSWVLPRLIGRPRAMRMMMLAERISAEKAEEWGMVSHVAEADTLIDEARGIALQLANGPTQSLRMIRAAVRAGMDGTLTEALTLEAVNQGAASRTLDFVEGALAFREKRKPAFRGT